jgi:hypothetical protein
MERKQIVNVVPADQRPPDRTFVVGWRESYPIPHLLEYRKKRDAFYIFEMPASIDVYVLLSDLVGNDAVARIRKTWDVRNRK